MIDNIYIYTYVIIYGCHPSLCLYVLVDIYATLPCIRQAFETAQAETTARIRAGLSLPASPEAKSSTGSRPRDADARGWQRPIKAPGSIRFPGWV